MGEVFDIERAKQRIAERVDSEPAPAAPLDLDKEQLDLFHLVGDMHAKLVTTLCMFSAYAALDPEDEDSNALLADLVRDMLEVGAAWVVAMKKVRLHCNHCGVLDGWSDTDPSGKE